MNTSAGIDRVGFSSHQPARGDVRALLLGASVRGFF